MTSVVRPPASPTVSASSADALSVHVTPRSVRQAALIRAFPPRCRRTTDCFLAMGCDEILVGRGELRHQVEMVWHMAALH